MYTDSFFNLCSLLNFTLPLRTPQILPKSPEPQKQRERETDREKAEQTLLIQYIHSIYPQPEGISSIRNLNNEKAVTSDPPHGG